MATIFHVFPVV